MPNTRLLIVPLAAALAATLAACGGNGGSNGNGSGLSGSIRIDGSSTVAPLSEAAADEFQKENPGVRVTVGTSGTGGGFEKFCRGEIDIADASRQIEDDEKALCRKNGVEWAEIQVANDGLSVVVSKDNDFVKCLTVAELRKIWDQGSKVKNWKQVRSSFPNRPLELYGPGTDSGTFDFFTKAINGEEGRSRSDYNASEDDNVLVQGVSGNPNALAYFGLSYYEQNQDKLKLVQVDGGDGCVTPSRETVQNGTYKPLARPLFIYPSRKALQRREVQEFVRFYIDNEEELTKRALFIDLTDTQQRKARQEVDRLAG
ncbi:PstS family phosphate ABC transporter substrate-binding protein [Thermoleophilum album]|uniref:PstS family phosphate ABC transporter substrate-binding protein n=1 Tax=Thermoleophilum album TaxID=29539 RepID=UPI00237CF601|nr:PstS family phosphate ABC transporter substrate-binding protein [Thermoleophilum album]WDT93819.1 PstS family phosphate ABC transporter substrate-binding protein [Thermoleophilum album]